MSTRNTILTTIQTALRALEGINNEQVHIGIIRPEQATPEPRIMIWWQSDLGSRADGAKSERSLRLLVGVLLRVDDSATTEQLLQASATYDTIHAGLETIAEGDVGDNVYYMKESPPGIEASGFDDHDNVIWIGSAWDCTYYRSLEST